MFIATDICKVENRIWFMSDDYNALNWMDLNSGDIHTVGMVPWERFDIERLFFKPFFYDNQLIITPYNARNIAVYDINNNSFKKKEIGVGFSTVCMTEGNIYAVSNMQDDSKCLYKYDIKRNEICVLADLSEQCNKHRTESCASALMSIDRRKIFFCIADTNVYFIYDLEKGTITNGEIPGSAEHYHIITKCPDGIFAITRDKPYAVLFSEKGSVLAEYTLKTSIFNSEAVYSNALYKNGKMYLNYILSDEIYEIDLKTDAGKEVQPLGNFSGVGFMTLCGDDVILIPTTDRNEWVFKNGKRIIHKTPYNGEITKLLMQKNGFINEREMSLKSFMEFVVKSD